PLLAAAGVLVGLGILSLWSLSAAGGGPATLAWRQLWWVGGGTLALLVVVSLDYRTLVRLSPGFYVMSLGVLVAVFGLGRPAAGARGSAAGSTSGPSRCSPPSSSRSSSC